MGVAASAEVPGAGAQPFSLHVLPNADARQALFEAEQKDQYRLKCQTDRLNAVARAGQAYVAAKQSETERVRCEEHIRGLPLPSAFERLGSIRVVYLMPSADGGMPHTRPSNVICLPMSPSLVSAETMQHELWHIHQRTFPDRWRRFLRERWDFVPYNGGLPEKFNGMLRHNPDTLEQPLWLWRGEWVPVCLFTNPTTPTLSDTAVWFYNTKRGSYVTAVPAEMHHFFGDGLPPVAYEHPYELAAYLLASGRTPTSPGYEALKGEW
jgi:hypothetical protein